MKNCRTITAKKLRSRTMLLVERSYAADLEAAMTDTVIIAKPLLRVLAATGVLDEKKVTATTTIQSTIWMIPAIL